MNTFVNLVLFVVEGRLIKYLTTKYTNYTKMLKSKHDSYYNEKPENIFSAFRG